MKGMNKTFSLHINATVYSCGCWDNSMTEMVTSQLSRQSLSCDNSPNLTWASCAARRLLCLNSGPWAIGAAPITAGPLIHPMSLQGSIVPQWCDPCVEERLPLEHEQDPSSTLPCSFLLWRSAWPPRLLGRFAPPSWCDRSPWDHKCILSSTVAVHVVSWH